MHSNPHSISVGTPFSSTSCLTDLMDAESEDSIQATLIPWHRRMKKKDLYLCYISYNAHHAGPCTFKPCKGSKGRHMHPGTDSRSEPVPWSRALTGEHQPSVHVFDQNQSTWRPGQNM